MVDKLLTVPSGADAEQEAPAGQTVKARHRLGGENGIPLGDEADPVPKLRVVVAAATADKTTNGS